jgi:hypothetical protein
VWMIVTRQDGTGFTQMSEVHRKVDRNQRGRPKGRFMEATQAKHAARCALMAAKRLPLAAPSEIVAPGSPLI